jgi:hypothetical protein
VCVLSENMAQNTNSTTSEPAVGAVKARPSRDTPRLDGAIVFVDIGCLASREHGQDAQRHEHCSLAPAVLQAKLRIL